MTKTKEDMEAELDKYQNSFDCPYDLDYYNEQEKNPFVWKTILSGLQGSIYEGGYYLVKIIFPTNYPDDPPQVYFLNKIFHPHVSSSGRACIHPLKNDVITVLNTVKLMFIDYKKNIDHSYTNDAYKLLKESEDQFIEKAKQYVRDFAKVEDLDQFYQL